MKIDSYKGEYGVSFTDGFPAAIESRVEGGDWFLVDERVGELYPDELSPFLKSHRHIVLKAEEETKSYQSIESIIVKLIEGGFKRNHRLIGIGGGIIQDTVAFIASVLYRGVDWIFFPTTLLAQGDSCIGSKTSVNFREYKNMLGGFYPPREVIIDAGFLTSLSEREIRSGLGEMAHYFMIGGRSDFELIRDSLEDCLENVRATQKLTERSLEIKKAMIELDEFDQGPRKIFNYGHTFGHALESYTQYNIPHGIAVSYGMDMANRISLHLGLLAERDFLEMRELFKRIWSGNSLPPKIDLRAFNGLLLKDKKNVGNSLNLILTKGFGNMFMQQVEPNDAFTECLEQCFLFYSNPV